MLTIAINDRIQTSISDVLSDQVFVPKEAGSLFSYIMMHLVSCCLYLPSSTQHISHSNMLPSHSWFLLFLSTPVTHSIPDILKMFSRKQRICISSNMAGYIHLDEEIKSLCYTLKFNISWISFLKWTCNIQLLFFSRYTFKQHSSHRYIKIKLNTNK